MGDRCGKLSHYRDAVRVRQLRLRFAVAPLALARLGFRAFALVQVQYESNGLVSLPVKCGRADQYRSAAAVFAEVLFFERLESASRFQLCMGVRGASFHSGGVRLVQRSRPVLTSSRSYPTVLRKA